MMHRWLGVAAVFTSVSTQGVEVVRYIPECVQVNSEIINIDVGFIGEPDYHTPVQDIKILENAMNKLQSQAQGKGFDGVLIRSSKVADLLGNKFDVAINAEFFNYCDGHKKLTSNSALLNLNAILIRGPADQRSEQHITSYKIDKTLLVDNPKNIPVSTLVSFDSAFGIKPGMTIDSIKERLGEPSVMLHLKDGKLLLGYGRKLWVLVNKDAELIFTSSNILSGYAKNLISFDNEFDSHSWSIEEKANEGDSLEQLSAFLSGWKREKELVWYNQTNGNMLKLIFTAYNPSSPNEDELQLTDFTLSDSIQVAAIKEINNSDPKVILNWLSNISRVYEQQGISGFQLPEKAIENIFVDEKGKRWVIPDNYLMLGEDSIRVTSGLFAQHTKNGNIPTSYLKALNLPLSKAEFRQRYPSFTDFSDRYEWMGADYDLVVQFESETDNAAVESAEIVYHNVR